MKLPSAILALSAGALIARIFFAGTSADSAVNSVDTLDGILLLVVCLSAGYIVIAGFNRIRS